MRKFVVSSADLEQFRRRGTLILTGRSVGNLKNGDVVELVLNDSQSEREQALIRMIDPPQGPLATIEAVSVRPKRP